MIIAAHRQNRPWSGETISHDEAGQSEYVEDCYLCPGNSRVSGKVNPNYNGVYVFDNDHPCVGWDAPVELSAPPGIYRNRPAAGIARVVCYSPKHNLTLAEGRTLGQSGCAGGDRGENAASASHGRCTGAGDCRA